jgi:hypothetical protein
VTRKNGARACQPPHYVGILKKADRAEASHEQQSCPVAPGYIGVLVFLISITAITEHPEWFN